MYDLTIFKLFFGKLNLKAYTKGERVVRFEATISNAKFLKSSMVQENLNLGDPLNPRLTLIFTTRQFNQKCTISSVPLESPF